MLQLTNRGTPPIQVTNALLCEENAQCFHSPLTGLLAPFLVLVLVPFPQMLICEALHMESFATGI